MMKRLPNASYTELVVIELHLKDCIENEQQVIKTIRHLRTLESQTSYTLGNSTILQRQDATETLLYWTKRRKVLDQDLRNYLESVRERRLL